MKRRASRAMEAMWVGGGVTHLAYAGEGDSLCRAKTRFPGRLWDSDAHTVDSRALDYTGSNRYCRLCVTALRG